MNKYLPLMVGLTAAAGYWYYTKKSHEAIQPKPLTDQDAAEFFVAEEDPLATEDTWTKFQYTVA